MGSDPSRLRQRIKRSEEAREGFVRTILRERGPLRRGAFVSVKRKCGKPNCRCADGEGHPAKYLSIKEQGRTRMVYVPSRLEVQVAAEAARYRRFRRARAALAKLAAESLALIDELERALLTTGELTTQRTGRSDRRKPSRKRR